MSHDKLRQLILIEEFKRCIHSDVLWKNPVCITLHLVEFHLLQYNDGFETREVDRMMEDIQDNKFDQNKPIKPPTCYYCIKDGHLISSSLWKWRVVQKQNRFYH